MESTYRVDSYAVVSSSSPETRIAAAPNPSNVQLDWVLAAYQNPDALPGQLLAPDAADATMRELKKKAQHYAVAQRVFDGNIADDGLGETLLYLAQSNILSNFDRSLGQPRHYINVVLWRFIWREIEKSRGCLPKQLAVDIADRGQNPALEVEFKEMLEQCNALLGDSLTAEVEHILRDGSKASQYCKIHRHRLKKWEKLRHFFPEVTKGRFTGT